MSLNAKVTIEKHDTEFGTLKTYTSGFILSIVLTISAFLLVTHRAFNYIPLVVVIVSLAIIQFFIQIFFFLHLGKETKPRWKLFVLMFMIMVVFILVGGSLWIMNNLNTRMLYNPRALNSYMSSQDGF